MAITYLGDGGQGRGTGTVIYSIPSGTQNGDLLLLVIETANQIVTEPGEWLDVPSSPQGVGTAGGSTSTRLKIMYRWVDGTSINTTVADPGNHQTGAILAFRGVDTTNPFNASAGSTKSTSDTDCTFPSITTTVDNCWVLLAEAHALPDSNSNGQTSGQTMASLSSLTEQVDYNAASGNGGGFSVATGLKSTAGSTGTGSATHSVNTADATITLALAPAPNDYPLSADPGTYSVTGESATLTKTLAPVSFTLDANAGSYAVTGESASLFKGKTIDASAGSYSLTGESVSLLVARSLSATAGSYALTGETATLTYTPGAVNYTLDANAGVYSYSGGTASLTAGLAIAANAGSYSLTGNAASLIVARSVTANGGSYSLTGYSASLTYASGPVAFALDATAGSYALTGQSVNLVAARALSAGAGSYLITGESASLVRVGAEAYLLTADAGVYAITGSPASLIFSGEVGPIVDRGDGVGRRWTKKQIRERDRKLEQEKQEKLELRRMLERALDPVKDEEKVDVVTVDDAVVVIPPKKAPVAVELPKGIDLREMSREIGRILEDAKVDAERTRKAKAVKIAREAIENAARQKTRRRKQDEFLMLMM